MSTTSQEPSSPTIAQDGARDRLEVTPSRPPGSGRVIRGLPHAVGPISAPTLESLEAFVAPQTPFDYLFPALTGDADAHLPTDVAPTRAALTALATAMIEDQPVAPDTFGATGNSTIPPIYTYLGQFIDHDLTARTDSELGGRFSVTDEANGPIDPDEVRARVKNLRLPQLNLDSLYGDGPTFPGDPDTQAKTFYGHDGDPVKFRLGTVALTAKAGQPPLRGVRVPLEADLLRDLPRGAGGVPTAADIGDGRNDENLIVAQLHVAFLRFHNVVVDRVRTARPYLHDRAVFARARQLVRWHYQWLVVHDYLPTVALPGVVDEVEAKRSDQLLLQPRDGQTFMPFEFSVAAFRFGHSMVRGVYDYNRNFGRPARNFRAAPFGLIFLFTGTGGFAGGTDVLPFNWVIEWDRFTEFAPRFPDHAARRIDTFLAEPLSEMANQIKPDAPGQPPKPALLQILALRNLLRGYLLSLPTGQAVARSFGIEPLSATELAVDRPLVQTVFDQHPFLADHTPLWYYVLKEAEVRADGNSLGEVGSRIVAETLIGQLRLDPDSYLAHGWTPAEGVHLPDGEPVRTVRDVLRLAGVLPTRP